MAATAAMAAVPGAAIVLRVAAQEGTEPKFMADAGGHIVGLCVDILRAIEHVDPGLKFVGDQQWLPLVRAHSEVASHRHDALCAVQHTAERERQYVFLDPPLFFVDYVLIARAGDPVAVANWDDVRKLGERGVILTNRGYAATDVLERIGGLQIDSSATSPTMNLQKLIAGRGRFFLHRSPGLGSLLRRADIAGKVRVLPQLMYQTPMQMALGNHVDQAVAARVRRAIEQLEKSGELARLLRKWDDK